MAGGTEYTPMGEWEYQEHMLDDYSDERIAELYNHYKAEGDIGDHPELANRYTITSQRNAPGLEGYQGQQRDKEPSRDWSKTAEDGYEVDPDELRSLRITMLNDLNDFKDMLKGVKDAKGWSADTLGGGDAGNKWVTMANNAALVFDQYYGDILSNFEGVAEKLKATADAYEAGHSNTQQSVDGVQI